MKAKQIKLLPNSQVEELIEHNRNLLKAWNELKCYIDKNLELSKDLKNEGFFVYNSIQAKMEYLEKRCFSE